MRKLILILLLAVVSNGAAAEWVKIYSGKKGSNLYADPTTIRTNGSHVKVWLLIDHSSPNPDVGGATSLSAVGKVDCDCKEEQFQAIAETHYGMNMGLGSVVWSRTEPSPWKVGEPGSGYEAIIKYACGKH